jgi:hypothetical protein
MSLGHNPQIKFQPDLKTRQGLERIADFHCLGSNGSSANEVMKLFAPQVAMLNPKMFFVAMAALSEYQIGRAPRGPKRSKPVPPEFL